MNTTTTDWTWLIRYVLVMIIALVLSTAFAEMDLFSQTWVIKNKLTAAKLVQFFGYSTALATLWIIGKQLSIQLHGKPGRWAFLQHLLLPLVTLIVVSAAHSVSLLILAPLMNADLKAMYNWLFILAILASAGWLVIAALGQTQALNAAIKSESSTESNKICSHCGATNTPNARFCQQCAKGL